MEVFILLHPRMVFHPCVACQIMDKYLSLARSKVIQLGKNCDAQAV